MDILRPCTGHGGLPGFRQRLLTFLKDSTDINDLQFRDRLILEAWCFIQITEQKKMTEFNESEGFMEKLFEVIKENQTELPILSSLLEE